MTHLSSKNTWRSLLLPALTLIGAFVVDLSFPQGVAMGNLYPLAIVACMPSKSISRAVIFGALAIVGILLGWYFSPIPECHHADFVLINRLESIGVALGCMGLTIHFIRSIGHSIGSGVKRMDDMLSARGADL